MNQLRGAKLPEFELGNFLKVADLIYFDGPLLSLYRNKAGENFLFYWCDSDSGMERWLIVKTNDQMLDAYLDKRLSLQQVVLKPVDGFLYCVDLGNGATRGGAMIVTPSELPSDYIPDSDSLYSFEPILIDHPRVKQLKISIDGVWDFADLHYFPKIFRESYALMCRFADSNASFQLPKLPMRDGFSSMHLFREILNSLPKVMQPKLNAVRYSSPGAIVFETDSQVTASLFETLKVMREDRELAEAAYSTLHDFLAKKKLLGEDASKFLVDAASEQFLREQAIRLAKNMKLPNPEALLEMVPNSLHASKVMLAYYRLIDRVLNYERDKKVVFPRLWKL